MTYCCTDKDPDLSRICEEIGDLCDVARMGPNLSAAAEYFELEGLRRASFEVFSVWLVRNSQYCCAFFDEAVKVGNVTGDIGTVASHLIQIFPDKALLLGDGNERGVAGIADLSSPSMLALCSTHSVLSVSNAETVFVALTEMGRRSRKG